MENSGSGLAQRALVNELVHGRDLAKKLQYVLLNEPSSSSNGTRELMMQNIVASFEKAIGISQSDLMYQSSQWTLIGTTDSPNSYSGSPKSQDSEGDSKDPEHIRDEFRKRKHFIPQETKRVEGCSSTGLEGPVEDGCSWRKYGQKDILAARYPRAYYRCTHRAQGCMATKQVQRCDDDPTFFTVSYRGKHTCIQASSSSFNSSDIIKPEPTENRTQIHNNPHQQKSSQIMLSFTDKEDHHDVKPFNNPSNKLLKPMSSTSFCFSSNSPNPIVATQKAPEITSYGNFPSNMSTYHQQSFPSLGTTMHGFNNQQGGLVREVGSTTSNSTNDHDSPATASDFSFAQGEFDQDIMFDSPNLFP